MKQTWKRYIRFVLLTEIVGAVSAWITRDGVGLYSEAALKPPLTPPAAVFPIVWTILYALMGIGATRISLASPSLQRTQSLRLFALQLAVNFIWSPVFFNLQAYGAAFFLLVLLWVLVLAMILRFREVDPLAALLQIPYLIWLTFAAYLSWGVWRLNG